ncbi:MAG: GNAT family N-acetyltransferase [Candidatus Aminicenantales bacterium]
MAQSRIIETARLKIVPFSEEHLTQRYVSWLNDPEVVRYSEQRHRVHTLDSCREYMRSFADTPNYFWALIARDAELGHIGNINAYVDVLNNVADVGILIGEKRAWKRGYGLEAWTAVCDYLLGVADLRKVTAGTLAVNTGMLQIMRRAGMIEDGRRICHCLYEGHEVDVIHMAFFRNDKEGHIKR